MATRHSLICVVLVLAAFGCRTALAQEYAFRYYGNKQGLTNLAVKALFQDRVGFLWVSTENGVFRYDGSRFRRFGPEDGIPRTPAASFGETPGGQILVGCSAGLYRLAGEKFVSVPLPGAKGTSAFSGIQTAATGAIWLGTDAGLFQGREEAKTGRLEFHHVGSDKALVTSLYLDGENLWYHSGGRVFRRTGHSTTQFGPAEGLEADAWTGIRRDGAGNLWVKSRKSLAVLRRGSSQFETPQIDYSLLGYSNLITDHRGRLLIPTTDGLLIQDGSEFRLVGRSAGMLPPVYALLQDREGALWIGHGGRGLSRWLGYGEWETFTARSQLSSEVVYEILPLNDGRVLAGTEGGLYAGTWRPTGWDWQLHPDSPSVPVHAVKRAGSYVWLGTETRAVARLDLASGKISWFGQKEGLAAASAYSLSVDSAGSIWAGTEMGLFVSDASGGRFRHVDELPSERTFDIQESGDGTMWVASVNGIWWRTGAAGAWRHIARSNGLMDNMVLTIGTRKAGEVWIGYRHSGVRTRISLPKTSSAAPVLTHFEPVHGFESGMTYSIAFDPKGTLWAGTDQGLVSFDGKVWKHFTRDDGLVWNDCDLHALTIDERGSIWVGTSAGLSRFTPDPALSNPSPPAIVLTGVTLGSSTENRLPGVEVSHDSNSLVAQFSALTFRNEHRVVFRYRLLPLFSDWRETTTRELEFPRLPSGSFRLELSSALDGNHWSRPIRFPFSIQTPWWRSWWFLIIVTVVPLALAFFIVQRTRRHSELRRQALEEAVAQRTAELEREKARAEEASRMKGEFLANMSHEIRTPINGILGTCSLAMTTHLNPEQKDYLEIIESSARSMAGLVNDILDFSRIEARKAEIHPVPFAVADPVRDTCRTLLATAQEKGIRLTWKIDDDVPRLVSGDAGRLRQILMNLVGNAVKFTSDGSVSVEVSVAETGSDFVELQFAVIDTGIGIPAEHHARIFEAFHQADGSTSRRFGGTGLGLAISSRLTELMGGRIVLESEPGRGSRFSCLLPFRLVSSPAPGVITALSSDSETPARSLRILLAEDNRVNQLVAKALLTRRGHTVVIAENGVIAVEEAASGKYDVILMDVQMPEMDGFDAAVAIRANEAETGRRVPILAVTAHADREARERCVRAGMDLVLTKPFEPTQLYAAIELWAGDADDGGAEWATAGQDGLT